MMSGSALPLAGLMANDAYGASVTAAQRGALVPTDVMTSSYTASAGDFVPVDVSNGSVTITLPAGPEDQDAVGVKLIAAQRANVVTVACSDPDTLNVADGPAAMTLSGLNEAVLLQYDDATHIWYAEAGVLPVDVPSGAARLGTDGNVGGPAGSALSPSIVTDNPQQSAETVALGVLALQPATGGQEPFQVILNSFPNFGGGAGSYNHTLHLGWNAARHANSGGTGIFGPTPGKPCMYIGLEDNYYDQGGDGQYGTEFYVGYASPDGSTVPVTEVRPFYARVVGSDSNSAQNATIVMEIGTDGTGSWQVRTTVGAPVVFVGPNGVSVSQPFTMNAKPINAPRVTGNSGTRNDLLLNSGSSNGAVAIQNSAGTVNNVSVSDAGAISLGGSSPVIQNFGNGFKLAGSASQKLGFFGATPVAQPSGSTDGSYVDGTKSAVTTDGTFTGGVGTTGYTVGGIVKALKQLGLIAS